MPGYYFFFICRMKKPNPELEIPSSLFRIKFVRGEQFAFEQPIIRKLSGERQAAAGAKGQVNVGALKRID